MQAASAFAANQRAHRIALAADVIAVLADQLVEREPVEIALPGSSPWPAR